MKTNREIEREVTAFNDALWPGLVKGRIMHILTVQVPFLDLASGDAPHSLAVS